MSKCGALGGEYTCQNWMPLHGFLCHSKLNELPVQLDARSLLNWITLIGRLPPNSTLHKYFSDKDYYRYRCFRAPRYDDNVVSNTILSTLMSHGVALYLMADDTGR